MTDLPSIAGFRILRELGKGGFATAYLAENTDLGREEVLKVLHPHLMSDDKLRERFAREARMIANLRHNNIVQIYRVGQEENLHYLALEYCSEGNLADRMSQELPVEQILEITQQLADALSHAHSQNIVHRDIKPENVLFRSDGSVALADFGIAKAMQGVTQLTGTGFMVGTPHYMSPEQLRGDPVDGTTDFYALGVVLYQLLAGALPFDGDSFSAIMYGHLETPVPRLPNKSAQFQGAIDQLLHKDTALRPQSVADLRSLPGLESLSGLAGKATPTVPRETEGEQARPQRKAEATAVSADINAELVGGKKNGWSGLKKTLVFGSVAALLVIVEFLTFSISGGYWAIRESLGEMFGTSEAESYRLPDDLTLPDPDSSDSWFSSSDSGYKDYPGGAPPVIAGKGFDAPVTSPFSIIVQPEFARIRVMNIEPAYRAGMLLPGGVYDVEVSAPGYQSRRLDIPHSKDALQKNVVLSADLSGRWRGSFSQANNTTAFDLEIQQDQQQLSGRSREVGAAGKTHIANWRGSVVGDQVELEKRYDGSGGYTHKVTYSGRYQQIAGGVEGRWLIQRDVRRAEGAFYLER